eukprot:1411425-Amphidinium_carterae.3
MARQERNQLSAQVVQQLAMQQQQQQQQQQAVQVSTPRGHIKLDFKPGRPLALAGNGKNWEEFAFKMAAHTATLSSNAAAIPRAIGESQMNRLWRR